MEDKDRAAFEQAMLLPGMHVNLARVGPASIFAGEYVDVMTQTCWKVWQMALDYAREQKQQRGKDLESTEQHTSQEWALALDQLAENTFSAWRLITVNGRKLPIPGDEASYETIVSLALSKVPPEGVLYTVVYGRGVEGDPVGSLLPGGSVKVRDGMVFSVAHTGNA